MKRRLALAFLLTLFASALFWILWQPASYAAQYRDFADAGPSWRFPLGADALGRDRLARLLCGSCISLLLAPAAAACSTLLAALFGTLAGYLGGAWDRITERTIDLLLSLPWLFLLISMRATLPLNVSPLASVLATFTVLALLGWVPAARVVRAGVRGLRDSDFMLQARASGSSTPRLLRVQVLPNLRPLLATQFWISIPLFILSEAELGVLGLGITEPLPSWGSLLRELGTQMPPCPGTLAALALIAAVVGCLKTLLPKESAV